MMPAAARNRLLRRADIAVAILPEHRLSSALKPVANPAPR
jgi:hypothetical protein